MSIPTWLHLGPPHGQLWVTKAGALVRGAAPLACANSVNATGGREVCSMVWTACHEREFSPWC